MSSRKSAPERKAEIVATAIRLAAELGPDRLTTQHIADAVGISQPAVFRHFPAKGDIWKAVAESIATTMRSGIANATGSTRPPLEKLEQLVLGQFAFINDNPAVPAILFSRELHAENEELRSFFVALMAGRHEAFKECFEAGKLAAVFRQDLNADAAAYLVLALIQGVAMRWSLNTRNFDIVAEGKALFTLQLDGFRPM